MTATSRNSWITCSRPNPQARLRLFCLPYAGGGASIFRTVQLFVSGSRAPQLPDLVPPIHQLPEAEFIAAIRRYNGTPEAVLQSAELMQLLLPLLRADFGAAETYVYTAGDPLDCPISAFGGLQDEQVGRELVAAWRQQTRQAFTLHMLPGEHFFLHSTGDRFLQILSQELVRVLQR